MKSVFEQLKEKLPGLQKGVGLAPYTTFKIGGPAEYFFEAKTEQEIINAVKEAKKRKIPFFILAGGSKLLIKDEGFEGLVIKISNQEAKITGEKVIAGAGIKLSSLISVCLSQGLSGLEWAVGIPGATLGGAIRGNAGAFGVESADLVKGVSAFDLKKMTTRSFSKKDCQFEYRGSIFKKDINLVILEAELKLKKEQPAAIKKRIEEIKKYRRGNHPMNFACAGSVFINPDWSKKWDGLIKTYPDLEKFKASGIIPAGWLIEQSGLKSKKIGDAQISEKHANFIINLGRARAKEVTDLIALTKKEVRNKFFIELKEELQYL